MFNTDRWGILADIENILKSGTCSLYTIDKPWILLEPSKILSLSVSGVADK